VEATVYALSFWLAVHASDVVTRRDDKPTAPRWPDDD
jgi:dihydropteroate synthase